MTLNGYHDAGPALGHTNVAAGEASWVPEVVQHLAVALCLHVRRLNYERVPVPREVEELAIFLTRLGRTHPDLPTPRHESGRTSRVPTPDPLLVTKAEAAQRLGVSVRTVERLVATGRLAQVRVERSARFRVRDLETYVESLAESRPADRNGEHPR